MSKSSLTDNDQEETKARPSASGVEKMSPLVSLTLSETTPRPQDRRGSSWSWSRTWSLERVSRSSSSITALRNTKAWISSSWIPQGRISICYQGNRSDWSELISFIRYAISLHFVTMILLRQYLIVINWCQNKFLFQFVFLDIQNGSAARAPLYVPS